MTDQQVIETTKSDFKRKTQRTTVSHVVSDWAVQSVNIWKPLLLPPLQPLEFILDGGMWLCASALCSSLIGIIPFPWKLC